MGNCTGSARNASHVVEGSLSEEEFLRQIEKDRQEGKDILRRMIMKSDDDSEIDWGAVIEQAKFLHARERQRLKKRERRWLQKQHKKALGKRRRYDAVGSFSVNLLTMKGDEDDAVALQRWKDQIIVPRPRANTQTVSSSSASSAASALASHDGEDDPVKKRYAEVESEDGEDSDEYPSPYRTKPSMIYTRPGDEDEEPPSPVASHVGPDDIEEAEI